MNGVLFVGVADDFHCSAIAAELVGRASMRKAKAMPLHGFPEEFQCGFSIPALGHKGFHDFAFLVDGPPEVVGDTVDLYEALSRGHGQWGRDRIRLTRLRRISAVNIGPKRFDQNRTVS
jgi:hypothetical protein